MNRVIFFGLFFLSVIGLQAQKTDKPNIATLSLGASAGFTRLFDTMLGATYQPGIIRRSSTPVIQMTFDQRLNRKMSLGASFSFQSTMMETYDSNNIDLLESGDIRTTHIALRFAWHWGKKDKIDYYSGFKTGLLFQNVSNHSSSLNLQDMPKIMTKSRFTNGLIPFGVRWFANDKWGVNVETSLGVASFISVGANYRWSPKKK